MNATHAYQQLAKILREVALLDSVAALMSWDEQTCMPPRGAEHRANQQALIARLSHENLTSPRVDELLKTVASSELVAEKDSDVAANVREVRRLYDRA